jgi:hypothetical protein
MVLDMNVNRARVGTSCVELATGVCTRETRQRPFERGVRRSVPLGRTLRWTRAAFLAAADTALLERKHVLYPRPTPRPRASSSSLLSGRTFGEDT